MPSIIDTVNDQYHPVSPHVRRTEKVADALLIPLKVWHLSREYEVLLIDGEYAVGKPRRIHSVALLVASIVLLPLSLASALVGVAIKFVLQESCREIKQKFAYPQLGPYQDPHRESKMAQMETV